ncbi:DUF2399 domain-containing protein [Aquibacillus koreensis]|uniref:DUF2399 domain-containing protein n=1 Tax=Aquibacillus koreensis TaxID=279446 RepID=A0A9X4AHE7_9BACI|nr:DUF2399 domain-containing protein [Aquibacillus koreensis]MCT2534756.1 DUF2399 domain-containing protein [Aquibacillus koreensis]MDC3419634.1 DUF2399 domain-containing protein [Aquibacillus koreensis]
MISSELQNYIQSHILLKNEKLYVIDAEEQNGIIHIPIMKQTARTRRVVAKIMVSRNTSLEESDRIPTNLIQTFKSPKSKKRIPLSEETYEWVRAGWVIREIRLERDERTVKTEQYRTGFVLYQQQLQLQAKIENENRELLVEWKNRWSEVKHTTVLNFDEDQRVAVVSILENVLDRIARDTEKVLDGETKPLGNLYPDWRLKKQLLFMHFLVVLYQLACTETQFDWKQIGATYYRQIGGSKQFDSYKKEFVQEAEELLHRPIQLLGLASMGTITPLFFAGQMQGKYSNFGYGSVHATTDLAVFSDTFRTESDVLWLVENRGVLTRMAYEEAFLRETKSFVLGVDGQVRSAHKALITQLVKSVNQVIIWTDVDEAGLTIAKYLYELTQGANAMTTWIVPPLSVVTDWETFERKYKQLIQTSEEEQEQEIGGVEQWKMWINH